MIEHYTFGEITIDGKDYTHDVIYYQGEVYPWRRKESHNVSVKDIETVIKLKPKIVIFGTGESGIMKVSDEAKQTLEKLGTKVILLPTEEAIQEANKTKEAAALHLTC